MIKIQVKVDNQRRIQTLLIEGHASLNEGVSVECAAISILVDTIDVSFTEIFDYKVDLKKEDGFFLLNIKKPHQDVEKILAPFIKIFYKLSKQFENITFEILNYKE